MIAPTDFKKHTLKELDLRWQEIELDIEGLSIEQKKMLKIGGETTFRLDAETAYCLADMYGDLISKLVTEQAEIEMYLIENESPGWTST